MSTILSARRRISRAHRYMRILRTTEGAHVSIVLVTKVILIFSVMASLAKYTFRIQNPSLFIECNIENGIAVEVEKSDIHFHNSSHLSKQVSNSFTVTGWAGKG